MNVRLAICLMKKILKFCNFQHNFSNRIIIVHNNAQLMAINFIIFVIAIKRRLIFFRLSDFLRKKA